MKDRLTKLIAQTDLRIFLSVLKNFVRFVLRTIATYRSIDSKASIYTDTIIGFKTFIYVLDGHSIQIPHGTI